MATKFDIPEQIKSRYPYVSWVGGRGRKGHKTAAAAPAYQGYRPQVVIAAYLATPLTAVTGVP